MPEELFTLSDLLELDLSNNSFDETIPESISSLLNLSVLFIGGNNFKGTMPQHRAATTDTPPGAVLGQQDAEQVDAEIVQEKDLTIIIAVTAGGLFFCGLVTSFCVIVKGNADEDNEIVIVRGGDNEYATSSVGLFPSGISLSTRLQETYDFAINRRTLASTVTGVSASQRDATASRTLVSGFTSVATTAYSQAYSEAPVVLEEEDIIV